MRPFFGKNSRSHLQSAHVSQTSESFFILLPEHNHMKHRLTPETKDHHSIYMAMQRYVRNSWLMINDTLNEKQSKMMILPGPNINIDSMGATNLTRLAEWTSVRFFFGWNIESKHSTTYKRERNWYASRILYIYIVGNKALEKCASHNLLYFWSVYNNIIHSWMFLILFCDVNCRFQ